MSKEEWKKVLHRAGEKVREDYYKSEDGSKEENNLQLIAGLLSYVYEALCYEGED